ncbi:UNVERIFIED_ORG: hypothetical protein ABIC54_004713 [Burkholderia sp. 1263]
MFLRFARRRLPMRLENRIGFFMPVKSALKIKNGDALNARRFINHEFTAPDFWKNGGLPRASSYSRVSREYRRSVIA